MQDGTEVYLGTATRAHPAVIQEMEKAKSSRDNSDQVEKCKNRHTQRTLQSVKPA